MCLSKFLLSISPQTCIKRDLPKLSFGGLVRSRVLLIEIITSDSTIFHGLFSSYHMFSEGEPLLKVLNLILMLLDSSSLKIPFKP